MGTATLSLFDRPCTLLLGAAGYGKTTTLRRLLARESVHWGDRPATARLITSLSTGTSPSNDGPRDTVDWLVLEDAPRMADRQLGALLDLADRLAGRTRIVLTSRHPPAAGLLLRWRRRGRLGVVGPTEIALDPSEVATTLADDHGLSEPGLARGVHAVTAGWPALVHLVARSAVVERLRGPDPEAVLTTAPAAETYLVRQVLADLSPECRRVLRRAAHLDPVRAELIDPTDPTRVARPLRRLVDTGILTPARPDGTGFRVVPLVAAVVRRTLPLPAAQVKELHARTAPAYAAHGLVAAALRGHRLAGSAADTARLLARDGDRLLASGGGAAVAAAVETLPADLRTPRLRRLHGDALRMVGEVDAALTVHQGLAGRSTHLDPGLAWRLALVHCLRGEPRRALAAIDRVRAGRHAGDGADHDATADGALLAGWAAYARGMVGDLDGCRRDASRALAAATAVDVPHASAAGHLAEGLAARLAGDRSAALGRLTQALRAAGTAGDVGGQAWVRLHRSTLLVDEAQGAEALAEADRAVELAESIGYPLVLAWAVDAQAYALARLGRLDRATDRYAAAVSLHRRLGSSQVAASLAGLGAAHLTRGRENLARAAYEEAARIAEEHGNRSALLPALAGLARVTARQGEPEAITLAERAVGLAVGPAVVPASCALAEVAGRAGDRRRAAVIADRAVDQARRHQDRFGLAEALRLRAATGDDPSAARRDLTEAVEILRAAGARIEGDLTAVQLGRLPGADVPELIDARLAARRLAGAAVPVPEPSTGSRRGEPVEVRTLGRFEVIVGGDPVPAAAWQSRKARDLLRILAARRGRPVSREQLGELLWPGADPARLNHRLSVVLSILRGVLDPGRRAPADWHVVAERTSVAIDTGHVELDVELFRAEARHGLRLFERGPADDAHDVLTLADQRYLGDFLVDDPYDDWAVPVRDEAHRLHLRVVRALAVLARRAGDPEQAVEHLRRALEAEPYDERLHGELIDVLTEAGRHGEAEEAYRRFRRAMTVIGVALPAGATRPVRR